MAVRELTKPQTLDEFHETVLGENFYPLWLGDREASRQPRSPFVPHLWAWRHVRQRIMQAGELLPVGTEAAERRALTLRNPGLPPGRMGTTQSFVAAIQMIFGNEYAPSHRHTFAALRYIMEGKGACTVVNGEPESMDVGDLLLTPSWYWHGHFSEHDEPMIWMDGLDVPFVMYMGAGFQQDYPSKTREQPMEVARDESIRRYGSGVLVPVDSRATDKNSPLMNYRWASTEEQLMKLVERDGSPYDGVALRYTNPHTGGPVMPTIDCWIQMLRPGERTKAHRHTGSVVYNVVRGRGHTVINGQRFDWEKGDIFCVPTWAIHEHANASDSEDAIMFSMNDSPVLQAFDIYREESYGDGGHQAITSTFEPVG